MAQEQKFVTKRELAAHHKEVKKLIKQAIKDVKKWDKKQDKKFALRHKKK